MIGAGNKFRRDDGAGPAVAQLLRRKLPNDVAVIEHSGEGASLMDAWQGVARVLVVDALQSGSSPGTINRIDASAHPLPAAMFPCSTHAFGIAEAVEVARALHELPVHLIVYGIEAATLEDGIGLSSAVSDAVTQVADRIAAELYATHS